MRKPRKRDTCSREELTCDIDGPVAIIIDDMISTGGTIEAAVHVLTEDDAALKSSSPLLTVCWSTPPPNDSPLYPRCPVR